LAVGAAALDVGVHNFFLAMTFNGIGWNFMFVAGSTLVTKAYTPAERLRTQAANDFLVFGTAALTSLSSGQLLHHRGWQVVLVTAGPCCSWRSRERSGALRLPRARPRARVSPRRTDAPVECAPIVAQTRFSSPGGRTTAKPALRAGSPE